MDDVRFLPPGVVVASFVLCVAGFILAIISSPVLVTRGGGTLAFFGVVLYETTDDFFGGFILLMKVIAGGIIIWHAVRLALLDDSARRRVVVLCLIGGVVAPVVVSVRMNHIDQIFVLLAKSAVFCTGVALIWYLSSERVVRVFREGGLEGAFAYRYCPVCSERAQSESVQCDECLVPLVERYEVDGGLVLAHRVNTEAAP